MKIQFCGSAWPVSSCSPNHVLPDDQRQTVVPGRRRVPAVRSRVREHRQRRLRFELLLQRGRAVRALRFGPVLRPRLRSVWRGFAVLRARRYGPVCVQCLTDEHCKETRGPDYYCDLDNFVCEECNTRDACAGNKCNCCPVGPSGNQMECVEVTEGSAPICAECLSDADCPDDKACHVPTGHCVDELRPNRQRDCCGSSCINCELDGRYCLPGAIDNVCAECRMDLDCGDGEYCLSGNCMPCTQDRRCGPHCLSCGDDKPYCLNRDEPELSLCVECVRDEDCEAGSCNIVTHQCEVGGEPIECVVSCDRPRRLPTATAVSASSASPIRSAAAARATSRPTRARASAETARTAWATSTAVRRRRRGQAVQSWTHGRGRVRQFDHVAGLHVAGAHGQHSVPTDCLGVSSQPDRATYRLAVGIRRHHHDGDRGYLAPTAHVLQNRRGNPIMTRATALSIVVFVLCLGNTAHSDEIEVGGFDAQPFRPSAAPRDLVMVQKSEVIGHLSPTIGIYSDLGLDPLVFADANTGDTVNAIAARLQLTGLAGIGLWDWLDFKIAVPFVAYQLGEDLMPLSISGEVEQQSIGDIRVSARVAVPYFNRGDQLEGFGMAIVGNLNLPTGNKEAFTGDGGSPAAPRSSLTIAGRVPS